MVYNAQFATIYGISPTTEPKPNGLGAPDRPKDGSSSIPRGEFLVCVPAWRVFMPLATCGAAPFRLVLQ